MRMFGRLFWFALGATTGYFVTVRVQQAAKAAEKLKPANMRDDIIKGAKSAAVQVKGVVRDLASDNLAS
jgi:hypothetical protein